MPRGKATATKTASVTPDEKQTTQRVEIPELKEVQLEVTIVGSTPLIVHRFGPRALDVLAAAQGGGAKTKKEARDPHAEFLDALYILEGNPKENLAACVFGFPAAGIKRAMVSAGQRFADEVGTQLMGSFSISTEYVAINAEPPTMRRDMVRLAGASRPASIAYRPEFWPWTITFPLSFNATFVSLEQILNLIRLAGFAVGIGDWRVERKGTFGQFVVGGVTRIQSVPAVVADVARL